MIKFDLKFIEWRKCPRSKQYIAAFGYDRFQKECTHDELEYHAGAAANATPFCQSEIQKALESYNDLDQNVDFVVAKKEMDAGDEVSNASAAALDVEATSKARGAVLKYDDLSEQYSFQKSFFAKKPLTGMDDNAGMGFAIEDEDEAGDTSMELCPDAFTGRRHRAA